MGANEAGEDDENALVRIASLLVLGAGLVTLFLGYSWFWIVFAVGFAVLVPMVKIATEELGVAGVLGDSTVEREPRRDRVGADASESKQDALDALRTRYANGELSDEEFERKVERLLETETLEGARDHVADGAESRGGATNAAGRGDEAFDYDAEARDRDRATER